VCAAGLKAQMVALQRESQEEPRADRGEEPRAGRGGVQRLRVGDTAGLPGEGGGPPRRPPAPGGTEDGHRG